MASSKKLDWYEPLEFIRAKSRQEKTGGTLLQFGLFLFVIAFILAISDWPDDISDWGVVALIATTISLLITYALPLLLRELPHNVNVTDSSIVVGKEITRFIDIDYAVIGTTMIEGNVYPVLSIQTKSKQSFTVGIPTYLDQTELALLLNSTGVRVE